MEQKNRITTTTVMWQHLYLIISPTSKLNFGAKKQSTVNKIKHKGAKMGANGKSLFLQS